MSGGEPVVLFQKGAVRLLDSLLSAPQQPIEEVLDQEEAIRSVSLLNKSTNKRFLRKLHVPTFCQHVCKNNGTVLL